MSVRLVFVVGCPRSGTTWLQLLLAQHPGIATLEETHLFPEFVSPLMARYRRNRELRRRIGLEVVMGDARFLDSCREFVMRALRIALEDKPDADMIVEKTPAHLHHAEDILELFPQAYFVNIVRDPRAVVASLLDAQRTWGGWWAPRSARRGALLWRNSVSQGEKLATLTRNYVRVSYEALVGSPSTELQRILGELQVVADAEFCARAASVCAKANMKSSLGSVWAPRSMQQNLDQTVRRGETDGWRSELTGLQIATIESVTRHLMERYGYLPTTTSGGLAGARVRLHDGLERLGRLFSRAEH